MTGPAVTLDQARAMRSGPPNAPQDRPTPSRALKLIEPASWAGQAIPPRRWLVDGLIPKGSVTMLGGDGGLGKSLLTMQMLTAASTGRLWLGMETAHVKAWGLFCEDERDELHRRMVDILDAEQLSFADLENLQFVSGVGESNEFLKRDKYGKPQGPSDFYEQVRASVRSFGAQLIVLDGLHDLFDGNENSRPEARQFVNLLRRIALEVDGAVVLCAHPSMSGLASGSGTSGSTAWNNAVRSRLYLSRPRADDGEQPHPDARELRSMKNNYGKVGEAFKLRWVNGVFVRDEPTGIAGGAVAAIDRQQAFLSCLDLAHQQGRLPSDARNSPRWAPKLFSGFPQARGLSYRELEQAMNALFAAGRIKVAAVKGPDRHPVNAIVRAEP